MRVQVCSATNVTTLPTKLTIAPMILPIMLASAATSWSGSLFSAFASRFYWLFNHRLDESIYFNGVPTPVPPLTPSSPETANNSDMTMRGNTLLSE